MGATPPIKLYMHMYAYVNIDNFMGLYMYITHILLLKNTYGNDSTYTWEGEGESVQASLMKV